jgi:hypothetical protein
MKQSLSRWLDSRKTIEEVFVETGPIERTEETSHVMFRTRAKAIPLAKVSKETGIEQLFIMALLAANAQGDFRRHILTGDPLASTVNKEAEMIAALRALGTVDAFKILGKMPRAQAIKVIGYMKAL